MLPLQCQGSDNKLRKEKKRERERVSYRSKKAKPDG